MWNNKPPINTHSYYVGMNPPTSINPIPVFPKIHDQAYLSPFTYVVGDVQINRNVFLAPFVSIRADEGSPFYIDENTNLQDGVVLHGLKNQFMEKNFRKYSIYIGKNVSIAHGALIHGPCVIEDNCFVGFHAIVYQARIGEGSFISTNAVVTNYVTLRPKTFVPPGAYIDSQEKADQLGKVPESNEEFAKAVQEINQEFPAAYASLFGHNRCSCGVPY